MTWIKEPGLSVAQSPAAWRRSAFGLWRSAELIWDRYFEFLSKVLSNPAEMSFGEGEEAVALLPVFTLLAGLALENVFKGLIVQANPEAFAREVQFHVGRGDHALNQLAETSRH